MGSVVNRLKPAFSVDSDQLSIAEGRVVNRRPVMPKCVMLGCLSRHNTDLRHSRPRELLYKFDKSQSTRLPSIIHTLQQTHDPKLERTTETPHAR